MKHILDKGEIKELVADSGSAGWSGETHLIRHEGKKYVLRRCKTTQKAKRYEEIYGKLGRYGFLPKLLGRIKKDVLFEYIQGRDLRGKETASIIRQVGKIEAYTNKLKIKGSVSTRFNNHIKESITGVFKVPGKKVKPILKEEKGKRMKKLFNLLKKRAKPKPILAWDANDIYNENYRVRNGKVYLVDIEAIKTRIKGFGIGKAFNRWFNAERERKAFVNGYKSIAKHFFNEEHMDLIYLNYFNQEINYRCILGAPYKPRYKKRLKQLDALFKKYNIK